MAARAGVWEQCQAAPILVGRDPRCGAFLSRKPGQFFEAVARGSAECRGRLADDDDLVLQQRFGFYLGRCRGPRDETELGTMRSKQLDRLLRDLLLDDGLFDRFPKPAIVLGQHVMVGPAGAVSGRAGRA